MAISELALKEDEVFVTFSKEIIRKFKLTARDPWPEPVDMIRYLGEVKISQLARDGNIRVTHTVKRRKSKYSITIPQSLIHDQGRMLHALGIIILLREEIVSQAMYLASFDEFDGTIVSVGEDVSMLSMSYDDMSIIADTFATDMGNLMFMRGLVNSRKEGFS